MSNWSQWMRLDGLNIVFLLIAVIAAVFGFLQWRASRKIRRLKVVVFPVRPIEKMEEIEEGKLFLEKQDKKFKNLSVIRILVINSGNVILEEEDFVEKIGIFLGNEAIFLNFKPINSKTLVVFAVNKVSENQVSLNFPLLNPGDTAILEFTFAGYTVDYKIPLVYGRVKGIPEIEVVNSRKFIFLDQRLSPRNNLKFVRYAMVLCGIVIITGLWGLLNSRWSKRITNPFDTLMIIYYMLIIVFTIMLFLTYRAYSLLKGLKQ